MPTENAQLQDVVGVFELLFKSSTLKGFFYGVSKKIFFGFPCISEEHQFQM